MLCPALSGDDTGPALSAPLTKALKFGGSDGTRTRDLRRDRPSGSLIKSKTVPTLACKEAATFWQKSELDAEVSAR
jgi:hypothetical protein